MTISESQLITMLEFQDGMNSKVNPDWLPDCSGREVEPSHYPLCNSLRNCHQFHGVKRVKVWGENEKRHIFILLINK